MVYLAGSWYESGTFWTIAIGALATLLGGAVGAWLTNRYSNPKRELHYAWLKNVSLLHTDAGNPNPLSVHHGASVLANPRIVDVLLRNSGKQPITASSFHGGNSIELDLDATIIDVLTVKSMPSTTMAPNYTHSGSVLSVPPSLLVGGQAVTFSVVVDGPAENLALRSPLSDVDPVERSGAGTEPQTPAERRERLKELNYMLNTLGLLVALVGVMVGLIFTMAQFEKWDNRQRQVQKVCDSNPAKHVKLTLDCPD
ncbi:hypothetical protein ABZZ80_00625 [Streptomyces sp. NPDC006356]